MRLSDKEKKEILSAITSLDPNAKIYLHGSRVNDELKGGDIDLLVISNQISLSNKLGILTSIKEKIGEQKIDLVIKTLDEAKSDAFVMNVLSKAVSLN